ncbi:hypothetical protein AVEN_140286-1, partial [Araneus ventricosus]
MDHICKHGPLTVYIRVYVNTKKRNKLDACHYLHYKLKARCTVYVHEKVEGRNHTPRYFLSSSLRPWYPSGKVSASVGEKSRFATQFHLRCDARSNNPQISSAVRVISCRRNGKIRCRSGA